MKKSKMGTIRYEMAYILRYKIWGSVRCFLGIGSPPRISRYHKDHEEQYRSLNKAVAKRHRLRRKRAIAALMFVILFFVLGGICFSAERPTVNVPPIFRQSNWGKTRNDGSCAHAAFITLLKWQGRYNTADMWKKTYSGGEWHPSFERKLEEQGIRFAYTAEENDVGFLEWACRTRRGCGVTIRGGYHMVALVHFDNEWAAILDNNDTKNFIWIPREQFIAEWKSSYSWAVTPVYAPSAPAPEYNEEAN